MSALHKMSTVLPICTANALLLLAGWSSSCCKGLFYAGRMVRTSSATCPWFGGEERVEIARRGARGFGYEFGDVRGTDGLRVVSACIEAGAKLEPIAMAHGDDRGRMRGKGLPCSMHHLKALGLGCQ
ncbi:hypothetical protein DFP72DRAFT_913620 [Ephemerocybe angulata]|uniref:Uncharacterized protein n=1 Tax=Ephemerocybe angulata TaxID=980116 RepID=A0A8H6LZZ2_9AGAR|nr:hypothetical protein DFP72DRAFT_913620 [Tulosesus angulatus]